MTVSAGVFWWQGTTHFVDESAKVDSAYYVGHLLPSLVDNCTQLLPRGYIFQQEGATAQLVPYRTGSKPTAQISLPKTSGLQIHLT